MSFSFARVDFLRIGRVEAISEQFKRSPDCLAVGRPAY